MGVFDSAIFVRGHEALASARKDSGSSNRHSRFLEI
jgi:hypothetical protein